MITKISQQTTAFEQIRKVLAESESIRRSINLNANENSMSKTARQMLAGSLEGFYELSGALDAEEEGLGLETAVKGDLMYRNLPALKKFLLQGQRALQRMLGAQFIDARPLSGVHAMECALLTFSEPGNQVWSLSPAFGGHFATQYIAQRSGRKSSFLPWDQRRVDIDFAALDKTEEVPDLIFLDQSLCLKPLSIRRLRERFPSSLIVYDASHTLGLILGQGWPNPFDCGADVVQGNTHKTFPGPQKAMIAVRNPALAQRLTASLSAGLVSSQHTHHAAALAVTALEMESFGRGYVRQLKQNTQVLSRLLAVEGFAVMGEGLPQGHMLFVQPPSGTIDSYELCRRLMKAGIASNARMMCGSPWLRLGTQEVTRRGGKGFEMLQLALFISELCRSLPNHKSQEFVQKLVLKLNAVQFSFDQIEMERKDHEESVVCGFDAFVS